MLTSEQIAEIKKRLTDEYREFSEYYEGNEDPTNTYEPSLKKAMEDIRLLIDHIENTQTVTQTVVSQFGTFTVRATLPKQVNPEDVHPIDNENKP